VSPGIRIIAVYFLVTYWLPLLANWWLADDIVSSYQVVDITPAALFLMFGTFAIYILLTRLWRSRQRLRLPMGSQFVMRVLALYKRLRLVVALTASFVALNNAVEGISAYRYLERAISELSAPLLFLGIVLNATLTIDLFYQMFVRVGDPPRFPSRAYVENVLVAIGVIASANGVVSMFLGMLGAIFAIMPGRFREVAFPRNAGFKAVASRFGLVVSLFAMFPVAWFLGSLIKATSSGDSIVVLFADPSRILGRFGDGNFVYDFAIYVAEVLSVHYYSVLFVAHEAFASVAPSPATVLGYPLGTLLFRFDYLVGSPMGLVRPELSSLSQLNYQLLTVGALSDRVGSTPGLLGSFVYVFGVPLGGVLAAVYLRVVSSRLDELVLQQHRTLSTIGALVAVRFLVVLFQSPFDFLIVFDDNAIWLTLLIIAYVVKLQALSRIKDRVPERPADPAPRRRSLVQGQFA
jgi:hypothetical protein